METITLMLVDDHPVVREGLAGMLAGQPDFDVVATARTLYGVAHAAAVAGRVAWSRAAGLTTRPACRLVTVAR